MRELDSLITQNGVTDSPEVIVSCLIPGACKSDFDRESSGLQRVAGNIMQAVISRTTDPGSRTLIGGAATGDEKHGSYMADCEVAKWVLRLSST